MTNPVLSVKILKLMNKWTRFARGVEKKTQQAVRRAAAQVARQAEDPAYEMCPLVR